MKTKGIMHHNVLAVAGLALALSTAVACGKKDEAKAKEAPAPVATKTPVAAPAPAPAEAAKPVAAPVPAVDAAAAAAPSQDIEGLTLSSEKLKGKVKSALDGGNLIAHGEKYPAKTYCNDDTTSNPGDLEVFSVSNNPKQIVYLCVGSLDGVENVVSIFEEGKEPLVAKVKPGKSTFRIDDDVLLASVKKLLSER